ncbi:MAG: Tol-Pal system beta propeller repeat protein TolB [candidate division WOR-3 bacterium]
MRAKPFTKFFLIFVVEWLIFLILPLFSQPAPEIWAKITASGAKKRLDLAVAEFDLPKDCAPSLKEMAENIYKVLIADLEFSLYFTLYRADTMRETKGKKLDFWAKTGASVLLAGEVSFRKSATQLKITLYDLLLRRVIATKDYKIVENWRWLAHNIADDVIKLLTGEDGVSQTEIAFSLKTKEGKELAVVDYDGANPYKITNLKGFVLYPDWSPKGDKIAFCSYDNKSNLNIYTYDLNRGKISPVTAREGLNTTPAWSPDGRVLACALADGNNLNLYQLTPDGRNSRRITTSSSIAISPTWSPSLREIAFVSDRTGVPQIYVINVDGTDLRRLTYEGSYNTSPAWSPRGDLIAYVSRVNSGKNQIFITDINGETRMQLTYDGNNEDPSWSPDGLHIAFASNRTGVWEIYTMTWNGQNQKQITNTGGAFSPTWSPRLKKN